MGSIRVHISFGLNPDFSDRFVISPPSKMITVYNLTS